MSRIAIFPYGISESANILRDTINEISSSTIARKLRLQGSAFRGRTTDLIVNWGSGNSDAFNAIVGNARFLNNPTAINTASNKVSAFEAMNAANVSCVENTTDIEVARQWVRDGFGVFCRTELRGHSGAGIVYCSTTAPDDLGNVVHQTEVPQAPLYTKRGHTTNREYRIHIFKGEVIFIQQKRRQAGYRDNPNYSNVVRNHGNGWIYAHNNITAINTAAVTSAVAAIEAVGLDFGAVDVMTRQDDAWVLEVNTAPGQAGDTTRVAYSQAILDVYNDRAITVPESVLRQLPQPPVVVEDVVVATPEPAIVANEVTVNAVIENIPVPPTRTIEDEAAPDSVWVPASMLPNPLPINSVVRITQESEYYNTGDANPDNTITGVIREIYLDDSHMYEVVWDNHNTNTYRVRDLEVFISPSELGFTWETLADNANIQAGAVVRIARTSRYHGRDPESNPTLSFPGVVLSSGMRIVRVRWLHSNRTNQYMFADLVQLVTNAPSVDEAPTVVATNLPEGMGEVSQGDTTLVDNGVYLANINGATTFVQYQRSINQFYTFGFDISIPCDEVTLISRLA